MHDAIERSAQRLIDAATSGVPCDPIVDLLPDGTVDDAYAVQQRVIDPVSASSDCRHRAEQARGRMRERGRRVPHALCGELAGLLRKEGIDQPQPFVAPFGPAIGEVPRLGELSLLDVEDLLDRLLNRRLYSVAKSARVTAQPLLGASCCRIWQRDSGCRPS